MPGRGIHLRSTHTLEHELQSELNEPRIAQLAARNAETRIIRFAASCIRWAKLDAIERIEELRPELQTELFTGPEVRRLEDREVPVIDACAPKRRIHARLVPERKIAGRGEAIRVEPSNSSRHRGVRGALAASRHDIRAQDPDAQIRQGQWRRAPVADRQGESLLKRRDTIDAPAANHLRRGPGSIGHVLLTVTKGQVI